MIIELHKLKFEEKLLRGKIFLISYYSESNIYIYIYYFRFSYDEWFSYL